MTLNAKKIKMNSSGPKQPNIEPGTYPARPVQLIDYGLQPQRPYKGEEKQPAYEIGITYELLDEFMLDEEGNEIEDKPRWISETMPLHNLKAERAKSTQRYMALDPEETFEGDFTKLIGIPCNVTIVNNKATNGNVYDNVAGITAMRPKDAKSAPQLVNEPRVLSLDSDNTELFLSLPEWIQDKIKSGLEWETTNLYKALNGEKKTTKKKEVETDEEDDSIPFDVDEKAVDEEEENW